MLLWLDYLMYVNVNRIGIPYESTIRGTIDQCPRKTVCTMIKEQAKRRRKVHTYEPSAL